MNGSDGYTSSLQRLWGPMVVGWLETNQRPFTFTFGKDADQRIGICRAQMEVISCCNRTAVACIVSLVVICLAPSNAHSIEASDIITALEEREAAIQSLSVKMSYLVTSRSRNSPTEMVELVRTENVLVDFLGRRFRSEAFGTTFTDNVPPVKRPFRSTGAFDGTAARTVQGIESIFGMISPNQDIISQFMDPRNLSTMYFGKKVSTILRERGVQDVQEQTRDGMQVLVIKTPERDAGQLWSYCFELCPSKGFALVKSAQIVRYPFSESGFEFTHTTSEKLAEVESGIWLPSSVLHETYNYREEDAKAGTLPPLQFRWQIDASDWVVNPDIEDSLFVIDFPPGTEVDDKITGQTYKTTSVTDVIIDQQSEYAKRWVSNSVPTPRLWLVILNAIVVCLLLMFVVYRRLHRV